jgi:hypothetical protein
MDLNMVRAWGGSSTITVGVLRIFGNTETTTKILHRRMILIYVNLVSIREELVDAPERYTSRSAEGRAPRGVCHPRVVSERP